MKTIKIRIGSVESVEFEDVPVLRAFYIEVDGYPHLFAVHARSAADSAEDRKTKPGEYAVSLWESGARGCCGFDTISIETKLRNIIASNVRSRGEEWVGNMLKTSAFDLYCNDIPSEGELDTLLNSTDEDDEL